MMCLGNTGSDITKEALSTILYRVFYISAFKLNVDIRTYVIKKQLALYSHMIHLKFNAYSEIPVYCMG